MALPTPTTTYTYRGWQGLVTPSIGHAFWCQPQILINSPMGGVTFINLSQMIESTIEGSFPITPQFQEVLRKEQAKHVLF